MSRTWSLTHALPRLFLRQWPRLPSISPPPRVAVCHVVLLALFLLPSQPRWVSGLSLDNTISCDTGMWKGYLCLFQSFGMYLQKLASLMSIILLTIAVLSKKWLIQGQAAFLVRSPSAFAIFKAPSYHLLTILLIFLSIEYYMSPQLWIFYLLPIVLWNFKQRLV